MKQALLIALILILGFLALPWVFKYGFLYGDWVMGR